MAEYERPLSPSMLVPLKMLYPRYEADDYTNHRQLTIVSPTTTAITTNSSFKLPDGWGVEKVPRSDTSKVDKYYYEPGTGHQFRSLREVERYINGEEYTSRRRVSKRGNNVKNSPSQKMLISGGKMLRLDKEYTNQRHLAVVAPASREAPSLFSLPEGWVVEEVPRRRGGITDKYYYEPGTGQKFRSLVAVERHLTDLEENTPLSQVLVELMENTPLSKAFKLGSHIKKPGSLKKNMSSERVQASTFLGPPLKVNWVLASPGGDTWNPYIGESVIPESVKQQWAKRFLSSMNDENHNAPISIGHS